MTNDDFVRCLVCFDPWDATSFKIYACGMLLCNTCKAKLSDNLCPNCRGGLTFHALTGSIAKHEIKRINDICQVLQACDLSKHKRTKCTVKCDNLGCDLKMYAFELVRHKTTTCPMELVNCIDCKEQVVRGLLTEHMSSRCPSRIVTCIACATPMCASALEEHVRYVCQETFIQCPYYCCEGIYLRKNTVQHKAVCEMLELVCSQYQCFAKRPRCKMLEHEIECRWVTVSCRKCQQKMSRQELLLHLNECPERMYICNICHARFPAKHMMLHTAKRCKKRNIQPLFSFTFWMSLF